jgi:hypothetical protein
MLKPSDIINRPQLEILTLPFINWNLFFLQKEIAQFREDLEES